eukprot:6200707-Pleurochrysis_carterae.AAC.5
MLCTSTTHSIKGWRRSRRAYADVVSRKCRRTVEEMLRTVSASAAGKASTCACRRNRAEIGGRLAGAHIGSADPAWGAAWCAAWGSAQACVGGCACVVVRVGVEHVKP